MTDVTNHSMTVGEHRAIHCEWTEDDNTKCCEKAIFGKPYCKLHMTKAYRTVTVEEFEKETDEVISEVKDLEASGIVIEDEVAENDEV